MSLLEPPAEIPKKHHALTITLAAVALVLIIALWFSFRYFPEKKAAGEFFAALTAGDTAKAYALWKPSPSYTMNDFLADWGTNGYYGPVRSYRIMDAKAVRNSVSIAVLCFCVTSFGVCLFVLLLGMGEGSDFPPYGVAPLLWAPDAVRVFSF